MRLSRCLLSLVLLAGCSIDTEGSLDDTPTGLGGQAGVNTGGKAGQGGKSGNNQGGSFPVGGKAGGAGVSGSSGQAGAGASQGGAGNEPGGAGQGGAGVNQGGAGNEPGGAGNAGNEPGGAGQGGAGQGGAGTGGAGQGGAGMGGAGQGGAGVNQGGAGQGNAGNEPGGAGQGGAGQGGAGENQGGAGAGQGGAGQGGAGPLESLLKTAVVWLDANDIPTSTTTVTTWNNKGTYPAATTSTPGQGPSFTASEAGFPHPSIRFSPSQSVAFIVPANDLKLQAATTFAVTRLKPGSPSFFALVSKHGSDSEPLSLWGTFSYGPGQLGYIGSSVASVAQVTIPLGQWFIYQGSSSPSAGKISVTVGPATDTRLSLLEDIQGDFVIGGYRTTKSPGSLSGFTDGDFAEVLIFDYLVEPTDQTSIQTYLKQKWGL